jgi:alpha/beta superfamily hydrolase
MIKEDKVFFPCGSLKLEGLYTETGNEKAVIVAHPNPLMGGNMFNNVVESLLLAFGEKSYSTLRFNFRGVGFSQGRHAYGTGEIEDLAAAIDFMHGKGYERIALAGYSFGAWITAHYLEDNTPSGPVVLISPPVSVYEFPEEKILTKINLIVCGAKDPFCLTEAVEQYAVRINAALLVMPTTDHFFVGREDALTQNIKKHLL